MLDSLKNNPSVLALIRQYEGMPQRDRAAVKILALVLLLTALYFIAWKPAQGYMDDAKSELDHNTSLLALVNDNKSVLSSISRKSGASASTKVLDSQQLVSSVTNMAKKKGIALKRFEPSGGNKLKVWVDDVSFDKMVTWLISLKKSLGVTVEQVTIEKDDAPGLVSARLTLSS